MQNRVWKLDDGLLVATVTTPAACTVRSPRLLRQLPVDHWVVSHTLRGASLMETPRGSVEVRAGQTFTLSLGQPSSSRHARIDRVDLLLSGDTFHDIAPLLDVVTGSVLDSVFSLLLGDFLGQRGRVGADGTLDESVFWLAWQVKFAAWPK